jgi:hypothetical protein
MQPQAAPVPQHGHQRVRHPAQPHLHRAAILDERRDLARDRLRRRVGRADHVTRRRERHLCHGIEAVERQESGTRHRGQQRIDHGEPLPATPDHQRRELHRRAERASPLRIRRRHLHHSRVEAQPRQIADERAVGYR